MYKVYHEKGAYHEKEKEGGKEGEKGSEREGEREKEKRKRRKERNRRAEERTQRGHTLQPSKKGGLYIADTALDRALHLNDTAHT